jgi:hypothetical protein
LGRISAGKSHIASTTTFQAEKLDRRIPFHFQSFRANNNNKTQHMSTAVPEYRWHHFIQYFILYTPTTPQVHALSKPWLEQAEPAVGRASGGSLKGSAIGSLAWFMVMNLSVCFLMSRRGCFYFVLP